MTTDNSKWLVARALFAILLLVVLAHPGAYCNQPLDRVVHVDVQDLINYFTFEGDTAYFVTLGGIEIYDFADPASPKKVRHLPCRAGYRIDVQSGLAYILLGGTSGIDIIDASDTSRCSVVGHFETARNYTDLQVTGDYMYLVSRAKGLEVVAISDPSAPVVLDSCFESGSHSEEWMGYSCLSIQGNYACVGQSEHGVRIIDITNPSALKQISMIPIDKHISNLHVMSDLLVVSAKDELCFYDLSDVHNPARISFVDGFSMLGYITSDGGKLVVYDDRLVALDISDPNHPEIKGEFNEYTHQLMFQKGYLVAAGKAINVFSADW